MNTCTAHYSDHETLYQRKKFNLFHILKTIIDHTGDWESIKL